MALPARVSGPASFLCRIIHCRIDCLSFNFFCRFFAGYPAIFGNERYGAAVSAAVPYSSLSPVAPGLINRAGHKINLKRTMKKLLLSAAAIGCLSFGAAAQNRTTATPEVRPDQTAQPAQTATEAQPADAVDPNKQLSNSETATPANAQPDPAAPAAAPADSEKKEN